ncbi:hypothetical protein [Cytophaga aurantiaca]|uniref:hypothetical protein n=1 Tax=Cytophaga aurantiaca TaxID=29530 RepID=UPI0003A29C62|nr:hypothetical protein [Cytophaga aurantiaca]
MKKSIEDYRVAVKKLAELQDGLLFENDGIYHAAIVNSSIFDTAEEIVRIYSNGMRGSFSTLDEYFNSITKFLSNDRIVKVIIDSAITQENKFLQKLTSKYESIPENIVIKIASKDFVDDIKSISSNNNYVHHFTTGDNRMFRLETNNEKHTAFVSFNKPEVAELLNTIFDKHFDKLKKVDLACSK